MTSLRSERRWAVGWALILGGSCAVAAPLGKPECEALKAEEAQLVASGVRANMEQGPEWAKAHLAPERLAQIRRLIEIGEQVKFRCVLVRRPEEAGGPKPAGHQEKTAAQTGTDGTGARQGGAAPVDVNSPKLLSIAPTPVEPLAVPQIDPVTDAPAANGSVAQVPPAGAKAGEGAKAKPKATRQGKRRKRHPATESAAGAANAQ